MGSGKLSYSEYYKEKFRKRFPKEFSQEKGIRIIKEPPENHSEARNTEKIPEEAPKQAEPQLKKIWIVLGTIILIAIILAGISFFTKPSSVLMLQPIDVVASNASGMPSAVYFKSQQIFNVNGWESLLNYMGKTDRLFGNEQYKKIVFDSQGKAYTVLSLDNEISLEPLASDPAEITKLGWFTKPEQISVKESRQKNEKNVLTSLEDTELKKAELSYSLYKNKPYFKVQFSAEAENSSLLGDFAYGIVLAGYDIYLSDSTILKNDNEIMDLNKTIEIVLKQDGNTTKNISQELKEAVYREVGTSRPSLARKGSSYKINDSEYEIFYDSNKSLAILAYSPEARYFESLFSWNVFRVYVQHSVDGYPPVYFIFIENASLSYDSEAQDWKISCRENSYYAKDYIDKTVYAIEDKNDV